MEEMLVDSKGALGKASEVSCDSWLESESREREYTEAVRDDLKELAYEFGSGEVGVRVLENLLGVDNGSTSPGLAPAKVSCVV